jgi:hypothetical protein
VDRLKAELAAAKAESAAEVAKLKAALAIPRGNTDEAVAAWKAAGCPHPAPAEVVAAKQASGLGWIQFTANLT